MSGAEPFGRVGFAIGTGRCGTHLLYELVAHEPAVASSHERNRMNEAFRRYARWYELPVDAESFLGIKESEIRSDLDRHAFSFEASAYLSLSVEELRERFGARFVLMIRRPEAVVNSYWIKGWYEHPYVQNDPGQALGFQELPEAHHAFSRLAPRGDAFVAWNRMTRIGKIAWFWNVLNLAVWEQFQRIPASDRMVVKLEEMSFQRYQDIVALFGWSPTLSSAQYDRIAGQRPGRQVRTRAVADWSADEIAEFEAQVRPAAELFGYESTVARLPHLPRQRGAAAHGSGTWLRDATRRLRRMIAPGRTSI